MIKMNVMTKMKKRYGETINSIHNKQIFLMNNRLK